RTAFAEEPETTIVAVGGVPGKAYEVNGWETWAPYNELYQEGRYAEAADSSREVIEASGYANPLYNLACCEALAGRTEDALRHLELALAKSDRMREYAQ